MTNGRACLTGCGLFAVTFAIWSCGGGLGSGRTTGTAGTTGAAATTGTAATSGDAGTTGGGGVTGSAGITGSGGDGGFIGGTGGAGISDNCSLSVNLSCPASLCGNSAIDTCVVQAGVGACPAVTILEPCDGSNFRGDTCAAHRFGSGTLTCSSICTVDTSSCVDCGAGPKIASCGNAPFTSTPLAVGIAATSSEVGIAWMGSTTPHVVTFERLSPTLQTLSTTRIQDPGFVSLVDVRVASLPSGWVITWLTDSELLIHTMDASGRDLGRTTVDTNSGSSSVFASRSDGGPLIVWQVGDVVKSAIIAADGRSLTTPRQLPFMPSHGFPDSRSMTAAYASGAFYVVAPAYDAADPPMRMVRIETDGTVGTGVDVLPGAGAKQLTVVAGADDLRVVYRKPVASGSTDSAIVFQKIAATGASASGPVVLATGSSYDGASGAFAFGTDTVAVLSTAAPGTLDGVRIGGNGQIATPLFPIMGSWSGLAGHVAEQNVARVGSDIVGLWYTSTGIRLARVTP